MHFIPDNKIGEPYASSEGTRGHFRDGELADDCSGAVDDRSLGVPVAVPALIGFLVGGGIAAGVAAATWKKTASFDFGRGGYAAFVGVPGGLLGALVGFLIGAQETDTWVPVKLPNRN